MIMGDVINAAPVLSSISVSPSLGSPSTEFTFSLVYRDNDNDAPQTKLIYIDGVPHPMTSTDPVYDDGSQFIFSTTLETGVHSYYFDFRDFTYTVRAPEVGS